MESIRDIKTRIKSVMEIRKITRAMKMVATAKYKKADRRLDENLGYINSLEQELHRLRKDIILRYNPYFVQKTKTGKSLIILVTADKGLCGGFNGNLIRYTSEKVSGNDLFLVGKRGRNFFRKKENINIFGESIDLFGNLEFKVSRKIMFDIKTKFITGAYKDIKVIYTHFESAGRQFIVEEQLLPIVSLFEKEIENMPTRKMINEPSPESVFDALTDHYLNVQLYRILLESELSEYIARMNAMDSATRNASDLIETLVLSYNRARQEVITNEILEIVGGAEALNK